MLSTSRVRDDLHHDLARLLLKHGVPGASIAVGIGDETFEAAAGVVNLRTRVAATPDAVFQIQSITKVWTATLVMQLVDEGLIDLDDPVRTHLPAFRTADAESSAAVTIRHLLTHTGGFEGDIWKATTTGDDALQRLVEDLVSQAPQHEPPGFRYSYSSAGMAVLGRIVEVKRGLSFASALRRHLADPLGIEEIAFNADEALGFNTAIGHAVYEDGEARPLPVWASMPDSNPAAGNQLSMSARALLAFGRMHLRDGLALDGTRILSAASAQVMRTAGASIPGSPFLPKRLGLVWESYHGGTIVGHAGGAIGWNAILLLVPEQRFAVTVLTNGGDFKGLQRDLVDPWLNDAVGAGLAPQHSAPARSQVDTDRYVGVYGSRNQRIEVSATDVGGLEWSVLSIGDAAAMVERAGLPLGPWTSELRRVSGDAFALVSPGGTVGGHVEFLDGPADIDGGTGPGADSSAIAAVEGRARFIHAGGRSLPRLTE